MSAMCHIIEGLSFSILFKCDSQSFSHEFTLIKENILDLLPRK